MDWWPLAVALALSLLLLRVFKDDIVVSVVVVVMVE